MELLSTQRINAALIEYKNRYVFTEQALQEVFNYYLDHKNIQGVVAKIALLDRLYSTNLDKGVKDIVEFAKKISNINDIDCRLSVGDLSLVNEIANLITTKRPFSFATKYCCLHNMFVYEKDDYSIVDSHIKKMVPKYTKQAVKDNKMTNAITASKMEEYQKKGQYTEICKIIDDLLNAYSITIPNKRRAFDLFIWMQGKGNAF